MDGDCAQDGEGEGGDVNCLAGAVNGDGTFVIAGEADG